MEIVRRWIEAWNRRDLATWLALFPSDREIDWSRARGLLKGVYRGRGELESFWNEFWSTFEDVQVYTVANGRVTRQRLFLDRVEALEAAGLRE